MARKFSEVLDEYLDLRVTREEDHPAYTPGYTNKVYWNRLAELREELDGFFEQAYDEL